MNSAEILQSLETWAQGRNFSAPYGILSGTHINKNGRKYSSITFGRARTLDATVEIFNRNFMLVRTSRHGSQSFKSFEDLMVFLNTL